MWQHENIRHRQHEQQHKVVWHEHIKDLIILIIIQVILVLNVVYEHIVLHEQVAVRDVLVDIQV